MSYGETVSAVMIFNRTVDLDYLVSKDDAAEYFCVFVDVVIGDFDAVTEMLFRNAFYRNRTL